MDCIFFQHFRRRPQLKFAVVTRQQARLHRKRSCGLCGLHRFCCLLLFVRWSSIILHASATGPPLCTSCKRSRRAARQVMLLSLILIGCPCAMDRVIPKESRESLKRKPRHFDGLLYAVQLASQVFFTDQKLSTHLDLVVHGPHNCATDLVQRASCRAFNKKQIDG